MTNIVNFERDFLWTQNVAAVVPSGNDWAASPQVVANDATVGQRINSVSVNTAVSVGAVNQFLSAGCLILPPPDGDAVPYRVKGYCWYNGAVPLFAFGYLTGGTSVVVPRVVGVGYEVDEIVLVNPVATGDPNYGDPLCFYLNCPRDVVGRVQGSLSVQRLISKPPQFASAVS